MLKKIVISSLLGLSLVLTGCGSSDSEGESRLETQQMLDNEDYLGVIAKLEASASSLDDYIALGAAYMGKAGLSLGDIITSLASASDTNADNSFAGFVTSLSSSSSSTALSDLDTATTYYQRVVNSACTDVNATLSDSQKDICLYIGLASTSSAAVTIDLIAGDVSTFGTGTEDEKLKASTCALNYAFDRNSTDCDVTQNADVNFTIINKIYSPLVVTVDNDVDVPKTKYYYLMNDANQTVLTKDYCTATDFATRTETFVTGSPKYYACPINETPNAEELTTAGVLVDVLNNGIDSIGGASSDETQSDIDEFKCELLGGTYDGSNCSVSLDGNVSEQSIIDYLNNQN